MLILLVLFTFITGVNDSYAEDQDIGRNESKEKSNEFDLLIGKINKEIKNIEAVIKELEKRKNILDELEPVQKYINMDVNSDLDKVMNISKNTKLDLQTSAIVVAYSEKFDLNPSLVLAVIKLESNFNQYEVGKHEDRGYMQIIPATEKWLAEKYGYRLGLTYDREMIFEPHYNIGLGVIYLSLLKEAYGNNYHKILSEYNRGPYKLREYFNKNKTFATSYSRGVLSREKQFLQLNQ